MGLAKIRELEWALFTEKAKSKQLGEELEIKRYARQEAKEMLETQKLQIESVAVEQYKKCLEYFRELRYYTTGPYLDKVTSTMTKNGLEVVFLVITELRRYLVPQLTESTCQKTIGPNSDIA